MQSLLWRRHHIGGGRPPPSAPTGRGASDQADNFNGLFLTRWWREMDSNHRSPARKSRFLLRKANSQRDAVVADDINAHEWVLLIDPAAVPPVTHTHALFAEQSQSIRDNLVACRATLSVELLGPERM
jgi:hypothetical protein